MVCHQCSEGLAVMSVKGLMMGLAIVHKHDAGAAGLDDMAGNITRKCVEVADM